MKIKQISFKELERLLQAWIIRDSLFLGEYDQIYK